MPQSEADQIVETLKKQNTPVWFSSGKMKAMVSPKRKTPTSNFYATVAFEREYLLK